MRAGKLRQCAHVDVLDAIRRDLLDRLLYPVNPRRPLDASWISNQPNRSKQPTLLPLPKGDARGEGEKAPTSHDHFEKFKVIQSVFKPIQSVSKRFKVKN